MTPTPESDKPLVLVVDDDWMNREMMQAYLERAAFRVAVAHDAETALQKAVQLRPRLILLDVRMGEKDGYEVCQELKSDPSTEPIPVVMLSALATDDARLHARQVGAVGFLTKTMNLMQLVDQIRGFITPL
ncbi:MAG: response regulator [Chloroflexota bacterium]|nr:response regulator [Chloroflexota bacterium]